MSPCILACVCPGGQPALFCTQSAFTVHYVFMCDQFAGSSQLRHAQATVQSLHLNHMQQLILLRRTLGKTIQIAVTMSISALLSCGHSLCEACQCKTSTRLVSHNIQSFACRVRHKDFLRPAADHKAVGHAMRFVKLLPSHMTDARTYNMLVSVCIAARDLPMALQAGMMLRSTGRNLDTFLYTSLITGTHAVCAVTSCSNRADAKTHSCLQKTSMQQKCKYASLAGFSLVKVSIRQLLPVKLLSLLGCCSVRLPPFAKCALLLATELI